MTMSEAPNRDQAALWNNAAADTWLEMEAVLDRLFAPIAAAVVEAGFPGEGGRVLDIGCGGGATTLSMARRLGPEGSCLGVDISRPLVEAATRRARREETPGAAFVAADAQTHPFEAGAFDAAISRFGVMFFDAPAEAFANIRGALRPGGRLAFAAWRSPEENPFMTAASRAAAPFLPNLPTPTADGPGQFGLASADRTREILAGAAWRDVELARLDVEGVLSAPELDHYITRMGPTGLAMQGLDAEARRPVAEAVRAAFDRFERGDGAAFQMACWLVTARA
jgi:SAM-dependent methyltransferase